MSATRGVIEWHGGGWTEGNDAITTWRLIGSDLHAERMLHCIAVRMRG